MSEELKPCGSCGSVEAEIGIIGGATFWVECSSCGACSSSHDDEYDAIAAWNRRPIEDALRDRIDKLEWLREVEEVRRTMALWHPYFMTDGEKPGVETLDNAEAEHAAILAAAIYAVES